MWDLPGPGLEPVSPALAGGFLTTVPPGKPTTRFLEVRILSNFLCVLSSVLESSDCSESVLKTEKSNPKNVGHRKSRVLDRLRMIPGSDSPHRIFTRPPDRPGKSYTTWGGKAPPQGVRETSEVAGVSLARRRSAETTLWETASPTALLLLA